MNSYLIPANAKKGTLILNIFRQVDLIIFATGIVISLIALVIIQSGNTALTILALIPGGVAALLVFPIPNYHNVLCVIQSVMRFYSERRNYIWKGWCFYDKFKDDKSKK